MKKIVLFTDALGSGGAQRQLVGLAILLKEKGYDVLVLTYHNNTFFVPQLVEKGIPYIFSKRAHNKKSRIWGISQEIKTLKPDVLIAYQRSPAVISCFAKLLNPGVFLIVSERNTSQVYNFKVKLSFSLYRFANYIVPNSFSQTDFILAHAPFLQKKMKTITNFVDTDLFIPNRNSDDKKLRMLSVGRITRQKNILNYLRAIHIVKQAGYLFKVDWYGYADQGGVYEIECRKLIEQLELDDCFEFHAPTSDIIKEYQDCSVFCLPSIYEGTPNVICEAMSCGLPILCSDVCDNSKIVENGINGFLFNPNDPKKISDTIIKFFNLNSTEKEKMGKESREKAVVKFSKEFFVSKYIELIE